MKIIFLFVALFLGMSLATPCKDVKLEIPYFPGGILPNAGSDWSKLDEVQISLYSVDMKNEFPFGDITLKGFHDATNIHFALKFDSPSPPNKDGDKNSTISVGLMFKIGQEAVYNGKGGCPSMSCSDCSGYEVDLVRFLTKSALQEKKYLADDGYAFNPHCLFLDGTSISSNVSVLSSDWTASWKHSPIQDLSSVFEDSLSGTYTIVLSRPLLTFDQLQQDVVFDYDVPIKFGVAIWVPIGKSWSPGDHYISCDWLEVVLIPSSLYSKSVSAHVTANTIVAVVLPVVSIVLTLILFCYIKAYVRHVKRELRLHQSIPEINNHEEEFS